MVKLFSIFLFVANSCAVSYAPTFVCEVNQLGLNGAVSSALGFGLNSDGWIEGALVVDLQVSRQEAENAVNTAHTLFFGGPLPVRYSDC